MCLSGIPENEGEDTMAKVLEVVNYCAGVDLSPGDIERSHRVGKPGKSHARQIIMRLRSTEAKFKLLKKEFRNSGTRIYDRVRYCTQ